MSNIKIGDPTKLGEEIKKAITLYTGDIQEEIGKTIEETANDCADYMKDVSRDKGWTKYARTWKAKRDKKEGWVVWNSKYYRVVHLLEKGHDIRNRDGQVVGHARAYPHVEKASNVWNKILEQRIKLII